MQSKKAKTPKLNSSSKLLSFDLETNGLHGQAFAIGAVVMDAYGKVYDQFIGRCKITGNIDEWVQNNVLPAIKDMPVTHRTYEDMREAFWRWYLIAESSSDYVLVNNGYPVEYKFLLDCQQADIANRYWAHPFPILDLSSLLIQIGQTPASSKSQMGIAESQNFTVHNPLDDAKLAALTAFKAFKLANQI